MVTFASGWPLCTVKFYSVVLGLTFRLSVINAIYWCVARRHLLIAGDGRHVSVITYMPPSKCWRHVTVQQWSMPKPDIGRQWCFLPIPVSHLHSTPPLGSYCWNIAITFGVERLDWCGYPVMKIIWRYVYAFWQHTNLTYRRTDGRMNGRTLHSGIFRAYEAMHT